MAKRVLILGGGPAALTCAYHLLTLPEPPAEPFEITILQMGWRLGGKGASGRNADQYDRIEEHGLHIMFGFYQNFFQMITRVYQDLDRPPGHPLRSWQEAFLHLDNGCCMDLYEGVYRPVFVELPRGDAVPGQGRTLNDAAWYFGALLQVGIELAFGWRALEDFEEAVFGQADEGGPIGPDPSAGRGDAIVRHAMTVLRDVLVISRDVSHALDERMGIVKDMLDALQRLVDLALDQIAGLGHRAHLLVSAIQFLAALTRGVVYDGVLLPGGYARVDKLDFADWLVKHGMDPKYRSSVAVRFMYDAAFSFRNGDAREPEISAGVCVRTLLRMGLTYKGSACYKMAAGMGDVIVAPLYEWLKQRGVRFGFFQMVEDVIPHPTEQSIESVKVRVQAKVKAGPWEYDPLVYPKGLPSWPSEPLYEKLEDPEAIEQLSLESYYEKNYPEGPGTHTEYRVGRDFDEIVLATPVRCLDFIAKKLVDRSLRWKEMVENVAATPTLALQAWFKPSLEDLGWVGPKSPLLSNFVDPLNTWSDMSQVLRLESWPAALAPGSVAYFCGAQSYGGDGPQPSDPDFPERMQEAAARAGFDFLTEHVHVLMPKVSGPGKLEFDWNLLVDREERHGAERYRGQYVRSNCEPQEWCTLSLPDTNQYRMKAGDTCFDNLTIAGDWIDNGFYVACLEGTVMGGIQAARAVSGADIHIIGEILDEGLPSAWPEAEPPKAPALGCYPPGKKIKVAVLGSGVGAMSAAYALATSPVADRFEITIYQYGWRLGGKCASGRNRKQHDRIEEHGLHIWGGCYENAFQLIQSAYREAERPKGAPLSVWYDPKSRETSAFWPHSEVSVADRYGDDWSFFNLRLVQNGELPGDGRLTDDPLAYLEMAVELLLDALRGASLLHQHDDWVLSGPWGRKVAELAAGVERLGGVVAEAFSSLLGPAFESSLRQAVELGFGSGGDKGPLLALLELLRKALLVVMESLLGRYPRARWMLEGIDLCLSVVHGIVCDAILERGFDCIDDQEFSAWLTRNGMTQMTLEGLLLRGWYDFFFAYSNGDARRPSLSAGSALRTVFRYVFTYKGAFFWKMQAGMGDTVFAPLYEVLIKRGVRFEFFSRVSEISCLSGGTPTDSVRSIKVERQLRLAPGCSSYQPLFPVKGVACFPSEPLWEQISDEDRQRFEAEPWRLESAWGKPEPVETLELERGRDFDLVVLGVSSGPLASLAPSLLERSPPLRAAAGMPTNQTIAAQLWLDRGFKAMGWRAASTVGTSYANPHNTWANMDELLERESWELGPLGPKALVYLAGTYTDAVPMPPFDSARFPEQNLLRVTDLTKRWLETFWGALYPRGVVAATQGLDFGLLHAPGGATDDERFALQYFRGNIDPSERYVLSPPGTASVRVRSRELGFDNLFGAGDWLYTGFNAGCVEAACMGGLQAARAISGYPEQIVGDDGWVFTRRSAARSDSPR